MCSNTKGCFPFDKHGPNRDALVSMIVIFIFSIHQLDEGGVN